MTDIPSHHMIYGHLDDYVTGESVVDTDDERYRQKIAHFLVEDKGFSKSDIEMRCTIETLFAKQFVTSKIDVVASCAGKRVMILRYGPGSLVTRERPAVAAARVLDEKQQIPFIVVTNGEEAEVLNINGKVLAGPGPLEIIPTKGEIEAKLAKLEFAPWPEEKREPELRILNAFDIEVCCAGGPCALPGAEEG